MCEVVYKPQFDQLVAICLDTQEQIVTANQFGFYCPNNCGLVDDQIEYAHSDQSLEWLSPKELQQRKSEILEFIQNPMSRCDQFIVSIERYINEEWDIFTAQKEQKRGR